MATVIPANSYDFNSLCLRLQRPPDHLAGREFTFISKDQASRDWFGLLAHEYLHFLQNISTPSGVEVIGNAMTLCGDVRDYFLTRNKWKIPTAPVSAADDRFTLVSTYCQTIDLAVSIYHGAGQAPLVLDESTTDIRASDEPLTTTLGDGTKLRVFHALVPHGAKTIALPLTGTALIEPQAMHAQVIVSANHSDLLEANAEIDKNPLVKDGNQNYRIYYHWLYRYFDQCLSRDDALEAGYLLANLCLQSRQAGTVFASFDKAWRNAGFRSMRGLRDILGQFQKGKLVAGHLETALACVEKRLAEQQNVSGEWSLRFEEILRRAKSALRLRLENPEAIESLPTKPERLNDLLRIVGMPAVILPDKTAPLAAGACREDDFTKATIAFRLLIEQIHRLMFQSRNAEACPLFKKSYCKDYLKGKRCEGELQMAHHGHKADDTCVAGSAAVALFGSKTLIIE